LKNVTLTVFRAGTILDGESLSHLAKSLTGTWPARWKRRIQRCRVGSRLDTHVEQVAGFYKISNKKKVLGMLGKRKTVNSKNN